MKNMKWLSLLLAMALIVSAMSLTAFAAGVPTITVVGNEGAPVVSGGVTTFAVKMTDFAAVKGMDVTITGTDGVVFQSIASEDITLTKDSNYTLTANKIHLVDLNGKAALTLTVTAVVNADADISVTAQLAASSTQLVENASFVDGKLVTEPLTKPLGAQVRDGGAPYGLRFIMEASCAGAAYQAEGSYLVDYSKATVTVDGTARAIARIGAVVARTDKAAAEELVAGANTAYVKDLEAKKAYEVTSDKVQYAVTVVNIPAAAADKTIRVRPYVAYYDENNTVQYVYGAMLTRSVNDVLAAV